MGEKIQKYINNLFYFESRDEIKENRENKFVIYRGMKREIFGAPFCSLV